MEYLIIWVIIAFCAIRHSFSSKNTVKLQLIFILIYTTLLFGLRYRVGIDTLNYMTNYQYTPDFENLNIYQIFDYRFEPLYVILNSLCKSISSEFYVFQLLHSLILHVCIILFFYKNTTNPFVGLFFYFFITGLYFNMEVLRESLAVGIFLLNFRNLLKHKWLKYYLWVGVSILFHYSAFILLFFPLALKLKFNIKYILFSLLYLLLLSPLVNYLIPFVTVDTVVSRLNMYMEYAEGGRLNINWVIYSFVRLVLFPVFILLLNRYFKVKNEIFEPFVCLHILLGIGCIFFQLIFDRFSNYTIVLFIAYLSIFLSSKYVKCTIVSLVFGVSILVYSQYYVERYVRWIPYYSIFNPTRDNYRELKWQEEFWR